MSSDKILYRDNRHLITKWYPIKHRDDITSGISCVFIDKGWKISAFFGHDEKADTYYLHDLLTDIKIMPDGRVEIIDLDELAVAFEKNLITNRQLIMSLKQSSSLLDLIYTRSFPEYIREIIMNYTGIEV